MKTEVEGNHRGICRLVLDVLKPHEPSLTTIAEKLMEKFENTIDGVNMTVYEMDRKTENIKMIIEGKNLDYEKIVYFLERINCAVHSLDQVIAGKMVKNVITPMSDQSR